MLDPHTGSELTLDEIRERGTLRRAAAMSTSSARVASVVLVSISPAWTSLGVSASP